jgi:hypothetical protein
MNNKIILCTAILLCAAPLVANDMKSALKKANDALDKTIKSYSAKTCVGRWQFTNNQCVTTIECLDNGEMKIEQDDGMAHVYWRGSYTSTVSEIKFHVSRKESKIAFDKTTDMIDDEWVIQFKVLNATEIEIVSADIPKDLAGYNFYNATLFVMK